MSEALTIQTLRSAMYDRLRGTFRARLEIHPDSRKRLGKFAKEVLEIDDPPSGKVFAYMGVEVRDNPDIPPGTLRVDREWTDAESHLLRLPPTDFDLPEAE